MKPLKQILLSYAIKRTFLCIFIIAIGSLFLWTSSTRPSILVIHTYDAKMPWVQEINKGLRSVFKERTFYHVYYHYMNLSERYGETSNTKAAQKTLDVIKSLKPNFLVLVDDITKKKIGKHFINDENINIIYCGIKRPLEAYGYETARNATGIHMSLPLKIINQLLTFNINEDVFHDTIHLTLIGDMSTASEEDSQTLGNYKKWEQVSLRSSIKVETFQEWKEKVNKIRGANDIILISNYRSLIYSEQKPERVPPQEIVQWTMTNAHVPIIGLYGFFVLDGGYLSVAPSPFELGEKTARIVENLIENDIYITEIPPINSKHFFIYLREQPEEGSYKLKIPALYETFARSTHHYYE